MDIQPDKLLQILQHSDQTGLDNAGIENFETVFPAGSYARRKPTYLDAELATSSSQEWITRYAETLVQHYPPVHLVSLRNALVTGQGSVVTQNNILLFESASEFLSHEIAPDGLTRDDNGMFHFRFAASTRINFPCLLLQRPWTANFGHWLVDCATILALLKRRLIDEDWAVVVPGNTHAGMKAIIRETIDTICPGISVLEHANESTWYFRHLRYLMPLHVPPLSKLPLPLELLRTEFVSDARLERTRRIYVSRADAGLRRLTNEQQIISLLEDHKFEIRVFGELSLLEQARLFNEAAVVMGVKGAGLANLIFSHADCAAIVLSPADFPDPFFWDIAGQKDMRYAEIFGRNTTERPAGHNDFEIEHARLENALSVILG